MKTRFFSQVSIGDETRKNLASLASLPNSAIEAIAIWFGKQTGDYPRLKPSQARTLSEQTGESPDTLRRSIAGLEILVRRMGEFDDSPDDITEDLVAMKVIPHPSLHFRDILARFQLQARDYYRRSRIDAVTKRGAAVLASVELAVAVKPVFDRDFEYGVDDITKYAPSATGSGVAAQISLAKSDCPQEFAFQVTRETLDALITELLALQKQMIVAEQALKISASQARD